MFLRDPKRTFQAPLVLSFFQPAFRFSRPGREKVREREKERERERKKERDREKEGQM
jgi:hypothetical protein